MTALVMIGSDMGFPSGSIVRLLGEDAGKGKSGRQTFAAGPA